MPEASRSRMPKVLTAEGLDCRRSYLRFSRDASYKGFMEMHDQIARAKFRFEFDSVVVKTRGRPCFIINFRVVGPIANEMGLSLQASASISRISSIGTEGQHVPVHKLSAGSPCGSGRRVFDRKLVSMEIMKRKKRMRADSVTKNDPLLEMSPS
uniref:Uncharacterized protein n=1 Tax=Tanacetum cinerariifolium TaxID=118510 RepID=A0A6L2P3K2_TANCI|nr:hypothetical protein [Tanacetum cinerariifolium]